MILLAFCIAVLYFMDYLFLLEVEIIPFLDGYKLDFVYVISK